MCTWMTLIKQLGHWDILNEGSYFLSCCQGNDSLHLSFDYFTVAIPPFLYKLCSEMQLNPIITNPNIDTIPLLLWLE